MKPYKYERHTWHCGTPMIPRRHLLRRKHQRWIARRSPAFNSSHDWANAYSMAHRFEPPSPWELCDNCNATFFNLDRYNRGFFVCPECKERESMPAWRSRLAELNMAAKALFSFQEGGR